MRLLLAILMVPASLATLLAQTPQPAAEPTVVLEGQVVDLRGEPVPAAKVSAVTWQDPDRVLAQTMCDGEGFFRLSRVPKRDFLIIRTRPQGYCQGEGYVWKDVTPVRIAVHDAVTVRGMLKNRAGAPVPGVSVRAFLIAREMQGARADATTDVAGRFTLDSVPLGLVRFAAVVPGEGLAESRTLIGADCEVTLATVDRSSTSMRIVVAGLAAESLKELRVQLYPYDDHRGCQLPPPWNQPVFDREGQVELRQIPDLRYEVRPLLTGFAFAPSNIEVKRGTGPHVLEFSATRVGSASLQCAARVLDAGGKPVAGMRMAMRLPGGGDEAEATSGEDGRLTFASTLATGTDVIVCSLDDRFVFDQPKVQGMSGFSDCRDLGWHECKVDPSQALELRVVPSCGARGRVLLDDGRPAAFVDVTMDEQTAGRWMAFAYGVTDRQGIYVFGRRHHMPQGTRIAVASWCGAATSEPFAIAAADTQVAVPDLRLGVPSTVEGTVVDEQGKPLPGIRVWLRDWDLATQSQRSGSVVEVITDRKGRYRFVGAPPGGTYLQLLVADDYPRGNAVEPFKVEAGKTYTFELHLPKPQ